MTACPTCDGHHEPGECNARWSGGHFHGPYREDEGWKAEYLLPMPKEDIDFIVSVARTRLANARRDKTTPLLSDILISRMAATFETAAEAYLKDGTR